MTKSLISRELVLATIKKELVAAMGDCFLPHYPPQIIALFSKIEKLPAFPMPNPNELSDKNIIGQTEDEFWAAVEAQENKE